MSRVGVGDEDMARHGINTDSPLRGQARCGLCEDASGFAGGCLWPVLDAKDDALSRRIEMEADQTVLDEGSDCASVWILQRGLLRIQRYGPDGRRQIYSLVLPGEIVGYDLCGREGVSLETATECVLCQIDRRLFESRIERSSVLRRQLYQQQLVQLDRLRWMTWALGALRTEERICAFLALATRFMPTHGLPDGSVVLSMQISRSDMADLLGTTVESISRMTHRLQDDGVLSIIDPKRFRIRSVEELALLGQIGDELRNLPFGQSPALPRLREKSGPAPLPARDRASERRAVR